MQLARLYELLRLGSQRRHLTQTAIQALELVQYERYKQPGYRTRIYVALLLDNNINEKTL